MFSHVFLEISGSQTAENKTLLPARCVRAERGGTCPGSGPYHVPAALLAPGASPPGRLGFLPVAPP